MRRLLGAAIVLLFGVGIAAAAETTADDVVLQPDEGVNVMCDGELLKLRRLETLSAELFCRGPDATTTTMPTTTTTLVDETPWPDSPDEVGLHGADWHGFPLLEGNVSCSDCTFDGYRLDGDVVNITGDRVTITNSYVNATIEQRYGGDDLTISDSEVGPGYDPRSGFGLTFVRNLVDRQGNSADLFHFAGVDNGDNRDIVVEDNYMWNGGWSDPDEHGDGIQSWGFGTITNVRIARNYVDATNYNPNPPCSGAGVGVNAALFLSDAVYAGVVDVIDNRFKVDGSFYDECGDSTYYTVRLDGKNDRATAVTTVTGNLIFVSDRFPGSEGAHVRCWSNEITWEDNWLDDGRPYAFPGNSPCE